MPNKSASNKNVYIFAGEDDFGLRQKVEVWKSEFAKKYSATSVITLGGENFNDLELIKKLEEVLTPSLFSSKKLIIARNILPAKSTQEALADALTKIVKTLPQDYFLVFWQDTLDRRTKFIKNLLAEVNVMEFNLPHGLELNAWIKKQAASLGLTLDNQTIERLAVLCGRDLFEEKKIGGRIVSRKEAFNLWQVHSELLKLASRTGPVGPKEVGELATPVISENVFALSDAFAAQNKKATLEILENLMGEENADEKSMSIKLLGLIAEQIRSQLVVSLLKAQNMDQNAIADFLGWSPGRVFITLRHASSIRVEKLKRLMARLLAADALIKSSDTNPKLLIDLLIAD